MSSNEESYRKKRREFLQRLAGVSELFSLETYRAALAEAIGTFMLLFLGLSALSFWMSLSSDPHLHSTFSFLN